jgi:hypothetical protein
MKVLVGAPGVARINISNKERESLVAYGKFCTPHRRREPDLVIFHCPQMRLVPKCSKFDELSYETCMLEKNWSGPKFKLHFLLFTDVFVLL